MNTPNKNGEFQFDYQLALFESNHRVQCCIRYAYYRGKFYKGYTYEPDNHPPTALRMNVYYHKDVEYRTLNELVNSEISHMRQAYKRWTSAGYDCSTLAKLIVRAQNEFAQQELLIE